MLSVRKLDEDNSGAISFEEFTEAVGKGILNDILQSSGEIASAKSVHFADLSLSGKEETFESEPDDGLHKNACVTYIIVELM